MNVIKVKGMSCDHCVKRISDNLLKLDYVKEVHVSLDNNTISVELTENKKLKDIIEIINDLGYDVIDE